MAAPAQLRAVDGERQYFTFRLTRRLARGSRDPDQTRRLLALAEIYHGGSKTDRLDAQGLLRLVLQAMRIIAEAVIFWAGRLKQAGKIRNVELSAGIFCKEIESRGAKRIRKRGCNGRSAPTRFSLESASGHP
jgi:hypothetical protein